MSKNLRYHLIRHHGWTVHTLQESGETEASLPAVHAYDHVGDPETWDHDHDDDVQALLDVHTGSNA